MRCTKMLDELRATDKLPSPRGVALDLLRMIEDESNGIAEIADTVAKDPAITSRLLKSANSAAHATSTQVQSVQDACARLGLGAVQSVALGFSLLADNREGTCELFDYERFWSRSLAAGCALKQLTTNRGVAGLEPDIAFTYGLLGRIGRLGLVSVYPERYSEILHSLDHFTDAALEHAEEQGFQTGTDWLSALMMDDWGLHLYRHYLDPMYEGEDREAADAFGAHVHLAEATASALITPVLTPDLLENVGRQCAALGIEEEPWADILQGTVHEWSAMGRDLMIRTRGEVELSDELYAVAR